MEEIVYIQRGKVHAYQKHSLEHVCCGDEALCLSFPSMFSLAANKDVLVADV